MAYGLPNAGKRTGRGAHPNLAGRRGQVLTPKSIYRRMQNDNQQTGQAATHPRVVVTGVGMVSALGLDAETTWNHMLEGQSGTRLAEHFADVKDLPPCSAAWIDWNPGDHIDRKDARKISRATQFAWKATQEALSAAQLHVEAEDRSRIAVEIGNAFGGWDLVEAQQTVLQRQGFRRVNPVTCLGALISGTPTFIGMRLGLTGLAHSSVTACATGISAIGEGAKRILAGEADVALVGGSDGYVTPMTVTLFMRLGAMSRETERPERACAPFSGNRAGMIVGEGAGVLVLESLAHALERNAPILAEFGGYALHLDPHGFTDPDPDGSAAVQAMQDAIRAAGLQAQDVDWIAAHGTATRANDRMETKAIRTALGAHADRCPVTGLKGMVGHAMGGAGAQNAVAIVKAIQTDMIPPTINYLEPDPACDLDYVPNAARPRRVNAALANGIGMGGQSASLALKRYAP